MQLRSKALKPGACKLSKKKNVKRTKETFRTTLVGVSRTCFLSWEGFCRTSTSTVPRAKEPSPPPTCCRAPQGCTPTLPRCTQNWEARMISQQSFSDSLISAEQGWDFQMEPLWRNEIKKRKNTTEPRIPTNTGRILS